MERCAFCGRKIGNTKFNFGLSCLKRICIDLGIDNIKSSRDEEILNKKIAMLCNKKGLQKNQKQMLTNRFLTLEQLKEVPIEEYNTYRAAIQNDINLINSQTKIEDLSSFNTVTLKQAAEINKMYHKHESILQKIMDGKYDGLQNLYFEIVRFAFSTYYNKKPYLFDMSQYMQYYILKLGVLALRANQYNFSADCLDNALKENPKDIVITEGSIIDKIKNDESFKKEIKKVINENNTKKSIKNEQIDVKFESGDLFLSLHIVTININGTKSNKWNLEIEINDVYDFTDLREVEQYVNNDNEYAIGFLGALANNFAMISASCNVINEYNIKISFNINEDDI